MPATGSRGCSENLLDDPPNVPASGSTMQLVRKRSIKGNFMISNSNIHVSGTVIGVGNSYQIMENHIGPVRRLDGWHGVGVR
jgi:hypothetical protein